MRRARRGRAGETARMMRMLGRYAEGHRGTFVLAVAMLAFEAITAVFEALPLAYIIDYLKDDTTIRLPGGLSGRTGTIGVLTLTIVLIAAVNSLADSMAEIYLARGGRKLGYKLRVAVFSHLQNLSIAFHDRRRTGDVITRVTGDVNEVEDFITKSGGDFVGSVLLLIGSLAFLIYKAWQVALLAVLIIPVLALISHYFSTRIRDVAKRQRARQGDLASSTQEMLTSIRVVQIFGRHRHDERRFAGQSKHAMDAALDLARLEAMFSFVVSLLQAVCIAGVIWVGIWLIDRNALTVGTLVFLVLLVKSMFRPTRRIIKEWNTVGKLYASVERINELLDREPSVRDAPDAVPAPALRGAVEFRDVGFAYQLEAEDVPEGAEVGTRPALRNISFTIDPGQVVALVGHSGAGKSTVAQLLPRLYDPQEGSVLLDGSDVRGFTLESLRSHISMVLQETVLFSGTVAENIAYGRMDATREEIVAAAVRANAHEFIERMPDGYDTDLTERATNLSGGQRQRIAIARAFIRDTPLLILDEPTTGLDADSTVSVLEALRVLMRGKTTLIISHDLNLFRDADRILVMDGGRIVQAGTHVSLMLDGGAYAQLYRRQFGEVPLDAGGPSVLIAPRVPKRNVGDLSDDDLDPLSNEAVHCELPSLSCAFDPEQMAEYFRSGLTRAYGHDLEVTVSEPTKAFFTPGSGCSVRYRVEWHNGAPTEARLFGARLFADGNGARDATRSRLVRLAESTRATRSDPLPILSFDDLDMLAFEFPVDDRLPTLVAATDPDRILGAVRPVLPSGFAPDRVGIEVAHYPREERCVLRFDVAGRPDSAAMRHRIAIFGKVGAPHYVRSAKAGVALREHLARAEGEGTFRVPCFLGYRPDLDLALMEAIPGQPVLGDLVRIRVTGEREGALTLDRALEVSARIAAAAHRCDHHAGTVRTLVGDLRALAVELDAIASVAPNLAARLAEWARELDAQAAARQPLAPVFSHGDLTPTQVLFDGETAGLIDLDTLCRAEPALDIGRFCAYLRVAAQRAARRAALPLSRLADDMCDHFVDAYLDCAGTPHAERTRLRDAVRLYEEAALLRMAIRSWRQLKAQRTRDVVAVIYARHEQRGTDVGSA